MSFCSFLAFCGDEIESFMSRIDSLQGLRPIGDIKKVLGPCFGVTGSETGFVVPI
jgi:hypothetical protein